MKHNYSGDKWRKEVEKKKKREEKMLKMKERKEQKLRGENPDDPTAEPTEELAETENEE